jgi:hypothetical protein
MRAFYLAVRTSIVCARREPETCSIDVLKRLAMDASPIRITDEHRLTTTSAGPTAVETFPAHRRR